MSRPVTTSTPRPWLYWPRMALGYVAYRALRRWALASRTYDTGRAAAGATWLHRYLMPWACWICLYCGLWGPDPLEWREDWCWLFRPECVGDCPAGCDKWMKTGKHAHLRDAEGTP